MTARRRSPVRTGATPVGGPIVAVACTPALLIQTAWRRNPALQGAPLCVADPAGQVLAACPRAAHAGVQPGQQAAQARLCCSHLTIEPPVPDGAAVLYERLLAALAECSPIIEAADPAVGIAYLGAWGLERLWGGWPGVVRAGRDAATRVGLRVGVGLGPRRLVALALALGAERAKQPTILLDGEATTFVHRLPLRSAALGAPPTTLNLLEELGVHTVGELAALPRAGVALRFGPEVLRAWDVGKGIPEAPLRPYQVPERVVVTRQVDEAVGDLLVLDALLRHLVDQLAGQLHIRAQAAAVVTLTLIDERGAQYVRRTRRWPPLHGGAALTAAGRALLAGCHPTTAVATITLEATGLAAPETVQQALWESAGTDRRGERVATLLDMQSRRHGRTLRRRWRPDPLSPDGWSYDGAENR